MLFFPRLTPFVAAASLATGVLGVGEGLNNGAQVYGKYFGSAMSLAAASDNTYNGILDNWAEFGSITPENEMKWSAIQNQKGVFDFSAGDQIVARAKANGKKLRCHALVWYQDLPSWVSGFSGSSADLTAILKTHVTTVVTHFKNSCYAWDVVNEALNDDGTYRSNIFQKVIGPSYLAIAFQAAAAADPNAKLYYNDYGIDVDWTAAAATPYSQRRLRRREYAPEHARDFAKRQSYPSNPKIQGAINLVNAIRSGGGRIDGMGLQGHYAANFTPTVRTLANIMNTFTSMNLDVAMTELDIRMDLNNINADTTAMQAQGYADVAIACRNVARCVGISVWGFSDKYSWVNSVYPSQGSAAIWDYNLVPKALVYNAVVQGLKTGGYGSYVP